MYFFYFHEVPRNIAYRVLNSAEGDNCLNICSAFIFSASDAKPLSRDTARSG